MRWILWWIQIVWILVWIQDVGLIACMDPKVDPEVCGSSNGSWAFGCLAGGGIHIYVLIGGRMDGWMDTACVHAGGWAKGLDIHMVNN